MMVEVETERTTEPFRREHVEIKEHLGHMSSMIGSLAGGSPSDRRKTMQKIVTALRSHIIPHAQWEEAVLYPVIDAKAGGGRYGFTLAMRHEHEIVGRWIDELEQQSKNVTADVQLFARRADQLLGLILAHFEDEEEVLLPVIDATMSRKKFEREILS